MTDAFLSPNSFGKDEKFGDREPDKVLTQSHVAHKLPKLTREYA